MHMKKKLIISNLVIVLLFVFIIITLNLGVSNGERSVIKDDTLYNSGESVINTNNTLTMMLETEAGLGEYVLSNDTTWPQDGYVFNETLSKCENGGTLSWDSETNKVFMQTNGSDKCYVYFDIELITLADYIMNTVYQDDGVNGLYYHDGQGSYTNADQEAGDNSYRYAGADPNNYVCFGSNAEVCPEDNLYRIIGVFDGQVKLIKNDYANSDLLGINGDYYIDKNGISLYYWNNSSAPKVSWDESNLNNVNLNVNFFNSFDSFWQKFILYRQWYQSYFPAIFGDTAVQDFLSYQQKKECMREI